MRRLVPCSCFSITAFFLEDSLCFCSLEYPELEIWMIFFSLASWCLSLFLFWLLLAHSSSLYYTFPPLSTFSALPSFFHSVLLESGNVLFLHNRRLLCLAEGILTFFFIKIGQAEYGTHPFMSQICSVKKCIYGQVAILSLGAQYIPFMWQKHDGVQIVYVHL